MITTATKSGKRSNDSGSSFRLFAKFKWIAGAKTDAVKGIYSRVGKIAG